MCVVGYVFGDIVKKNLVFVFDGGEKSIVSKFSIVVVECLVFRC